MEEGDQSNVSNKISGVHWSPLEAIGSGDQKYMLLLAIYYGSPLEAIGGEVCDWRKVIDANVSNKISGVHWSPLEAIGGGDQKCILLLALY